jgi:hypothetical protein
MAANFATGTAGVVDTGSKLAARHVDDTSSKFTANVNNTDGK